MIAAMLREDRLLGTGGYGAMFNAEHLFEVADAIIREAGFAIPVRQLVTPR